MDIVQHMLNGLREQSSRAVRRATADDVPALSEALARSFATDPVVNWLAPQHIGRTARRELMFRLEMQAYVLPQGGTAFTADDHDGLVGGCLVLPPDGWKAPLSMDGRTALRWMWALGTSLPRAVRFVRVAEQHHPDEPHYYVRWVGVRPHLQRQGLGTALMQPALAQCDQENAAAYIEASTERSAALYGRLGFEHLGVVQLPDGGPRIWPMRRPPR
jgi:GNAT superfamily N-acetyltransferase